MNDFMGPSSSSILGFCYPENPHLQSRWSAKSTFLKR